SLLIAKSAGRYNGGSDSRTLLLPQLFHTIHFPTSTSPFNPERPNQSPSSYQSPMTPDITSVTCWLSCPFSLFTLSLLTPRDICYGSSHPPPPRTYCFHNSNTSSPSAAGEPLYSLRQTRKTADEFAIELIQLARHTFPNLPPTDHDDLVLDRFISGL
ncbi:unnamed protein product, partial [Schistocephalus solidus]|uniref:Uncharacterized protein n=1 Tax=Schistocephalus solidus TaxID=70667 RepID=A0A183SBZ6_SCHSO